MKSFRHDFKMSKPGTSTEYWDSDFMGYAHGDISGFFSMYHGTKSDIPSFLRKEIEMAEDGQAVYEFIQNAADSNSTHFYMFYNEKYLLAINNGEVFEKAGIESILNAGQSFGKNDSPDKIGRFGIGFKLVHRLLGKNSGLDELCKEYKGPQLFSWSRKKDFEDFGTTASFEEESQNLENDSPWLMKIIITNFPVSIDESVKNIDFINHIPYPKTEVLEFQSFLKDNLPSIDTETMSQGTMIFIKLGENKIDLLNKDQNDINSRLENTLYFLKNIAHLQVNEKIIQRHKGFVLEDKFEIFPDENAFKNIGLTEERDKKFPLHLQFGYLPYSALDSSSLVNGSPNFYKYFPMEDTVYNLNFIFHSNVFSIGSNRRHLHQTDINLELLKLLSTKMKELMEIKKVQSGESYNDIFANILLSECNKDFVSSHLMSSLYQYCIQNVPTQSGDYKQNDKVIIKNIKINCDPSDFGVDKSWFVWENIGEHKQLINRCKSELKLEEYSLKKILEKGNVSFINKWIKQLSPLELSEFIAELEINIPENIVDIQFIKLENGSFSSIREIESSDVIIKFQKIDTIQGVLRSLGFVLSVSDFIESPLLRLNISKTILYLKDDGENNLYEKKIINKLSESSLTPSEKRLLFLALKDFKYIGETILSEKLHLFCDINGVKKPLCQLIDPSIPGIEEWLKPYTIKYEEVFAEIKSESYLRNSNTIFNTIIEPQWDNIIGKINETNVETFYRSIVKYYEKAVNPKSIKSKSIIYCTGKGWCLPNSVYFHSQLVSFESYNYLCELLDSLGFYYPQKSLLPFLINEPFLLKDSSVEQLFISGAYPQKAIFSLLEFCKGKYDIFKYGYFEVSGSLIEFTVDSTCRQYYSDDSIIVDFTENQASSALKLLPNELLQFRQATIQGEELLEKIIHESAFDWKSNEDVLKRLLQILDNSGLSRIVKRFINDISHINLLVSEKYSEDDLTFLWVKLFNSVFEVEEIESLKRKVFLDGTKLSELEWNNLIEDENYQIELAAILPEFGESKSVSQVKDALKVTKKFDDNKLNALFHSDATPSGKDLVEIANRMLDSELQCLKNVHQLRLVLLLLKDRLIPSLDGINVMALNGKWYSLKDDWYIKRNNFINEDAVLDERYKSIGKQHFGSNTILTKPYYYRDKSKFICPHLCDSLDDEQLISFFELIKDELKRNGLAQVDWLTEFTDRIGFYPETTILAEDRFVLEEEKIPTVLLKWSKISTDNQSTLLSVGIQSESSSIIKLRRYLIDGSEDYKFQGFVENENDLILLSNTLKLMAESEVEFNDEKGKVIKQITEFIGTGSDISETPLPIITRIEGNDLYYQMQFVQYSYSLNDDFFGNAKNYSGVEFHLFIQNLIDIVGNVIDPDCLSKRWINQYSKELSFSEPIIDFDQLQQDSIACNLENYISWKELSESELSIYFISDSIPYQVSVVDFEDDIKVGFRNGEYYFDSDTLTLSTKRANYQEAIIKELQGNKYIDFDEDDLMILLGSSGLLPSSKETELQKEIQWLKEKLNQFEPEGGRERGGLPKEHQNDWSIEARRMLKEQLEKYPEFDCSGWDDSNHPSSVVKGVKYSGKVCTWVVRSAMGNESQFHLTPWEWTLFEKPNTFLALRLNQQEIKIYGIDEDIRQIIFQANHTINLNFDSEKLSFNGINAFAELLVKYQIWGSGLVFKNPDYSAGKSFKELDKCKEGIVKSLNEEAL